MAYADEPLRVIVFRMAERGVTRVPVLARGAERKLLGMLSLDDLLHARTRVLTEERDRERVIRIKLPFQRQPEKAVSGVMRLANSRQPWWLLPNLLSLDAPIVALAWQYVLMVSFHTQTDWFGRAGLALAVWAIYLLDRLLDTRRPQESTEAARHRFTRRHRRTMWFLLGIAVAAGMASMINAPAALIVDGVFLSAVVMVYLIGVQIGMLPIPKEHAVSILFATGVALGPLAGGCHLPAILACRDSAVFPLPCQHGRDRTRRVVPAHSLCSSSAARLHAMDCRALSRILSDGDAGLRTGSGM